MNLCVVVIPIYKTNPSRSEEASFRQCLTVLSDFDITIVTFEDLDLAPYQNISKKVGKTYRVEYFDQNYFKSLDGYNKLCLSPSLYKRFLNYKYMLLYQLDAWVFRNELEYWCKKDYDYIGGPFFRNISKDKNNPIFTKELIGIGNGGFSLRKIQYCLNVLSGPSNSPYIKPNFLWKMYYSDEIRTQKGIPALTSLVKIYIKLILKTLGFRNTLRYFIESGVFEDKIFGYFTPNAWNIKAKIPSGEEASQFSAEVNPSFIYDKNGKLPFGCHAFEKWEFDTFWSKHIKL